MSLRGPEAEIEGALKIPLPSSGGKSRGQAGRGLGSCYGLQSRAMSMYDVKQCSTIFQALFVSLKPDRTFEISQRRLENTLGSKHAILRHFYLAKFRKYRIKSIVKNDILGHL